MRRGREGEGEVIVGWGIFGEVETIRPWVAGCLRLYHSTRRQPICNGIFSSKTHIKDISNIFSRIVPSARRALDSRCRMFSTLANEWRQPVSHMTYSGVTVTRSHFLRKLELKPQFKPRKTQAARRHASYAGMVANCEWLRRNVYNSCGCGFKHLEGSTPPGPQSDSHSLRSRAQSCLRKVELTELMLSSDC